MSHKCPIDTCSCVLPWNVLMCRSHWSLVSRELQGRVYGTWNRGNPTQGYLATRQEAIDNVHEQLRSNTNV